MERLHRILSTTYLTSLCPLCNQEGRELKEDAVHALLECEANQESPTILMPLLRTHQSGITAIQVLALEIEVAPAVELPLMWINATSLYLIWTQRQEGTIPQTKFRAELRARSKYLKLSDNENALTMTRLELDRMLI